MIVNAEKIGDGLTIKSENDSRITKIGKFLRATSLDEVPQLFNVLIGQMSLVDHAHLLLIIHIMGMRTIQIGQKEISNVQVLQD